MSDLISRQDAIDAVADYIHNVDKVYGTGRLAAEDCRDAAHSVIDELPSAERKGHWIWSPKDIDGTVSGCCSNCSFSHLFIGGHTAQYNYCPNCGARMVGDEDA